MPAGFQILLVNGKPSLKGNFKQVNWLIAESISKPAYRPLIYE